MKRKLSWFLLIVLVGIGVFNLAKPLPEGLSVRGELHKVPESSVVFLADRTWVDQEGKRQSEQEIFDVVFRMIDEAQELILIDMFLFNDFQGNPPETTRALSSELVGALIAKKQKNPQIEIIVVTDQINTVYGGYPSLKLDGMRAESIQVVETDLLRLRDSNPIYSSFWRAFIQVFGNVDTGGFLTNPLDHDGYLVSARSYLALMNFKANHRKLVVADTYRGGVKKMRTLVTSANPHDGSSAHGNIAVLVADSLWEDVYASEAATANYSGYVFPKAPTNVVDVEGSVQVGLLTEGKIQEVLLEKIDITRAGDSIDMAMFYLSERDTVKALIKAANRGVNVRLLLDPNKDAFGRQKNGIPNRQVAHELIKQTDGKISVRWCDTHGEQCHAKLVLIADDGVGYQMIAGSANLTRRNINDYNLETNVYVLSDTATGAIKDAQDYFEEVWTNAYGRGYSVDYSVYAEESFIKTVLYRIMEGTGLSTF